MWNVNGEKLGPQFRPHFKFYCSRNRRVLAEVTKWCDSLHCHRWVQRGCQCNFWKLCTQACSKTSVHRYKVSWQWGKAMGRTWEGGERLEALLGRKEAGGGGSTKGAPFPSTYTTRIVGSCPSRYTAILAIYQETENIFTYLQQGVEYPHPQDAVHVLLMDVHRCWWGGDKIGQTL